MCIANAMDQLHKKLKPGVLGDLDIGQRLTKGTEKKAGYAPVTPIEFVRSTSLRYTSPAAGLQINRNAPRG